MIDLQTATDLWDKTLETNDEIYQKFLMGTKSLPYLKDHRNWVKQRNHGYGEDSFHYVWYSLCKDLHNSFGSVNFMEIGVYMGQVLSLIPLISSKENIPCTFVGVTPLDSSGDQYSNYRSTDYLSKITQIFVEHNLQFTPEENLIVGSSTDKEIINEFTSRKYNLIYIDGCHEYDFVVEDFKNSDACLEVGGYLVFDDASLHLDMPFYLGFTGHPAVSDAVRDVVEINPNYEEVIACGHNRVFKKIK